MDVREAVLAVMRGSAEEQLHWTVIWDRALRSGYIDALADPDARNAFLKGLNALANAGALERTSTGTYRVAHE